MTEYMQRKHLLDQGVAPEDILFNDGPPDADGNPTIIPHFSIPADRVKTP